MGSESGNISVIIAAYNEEQGVEISVLSTRQTFHDLGLDYEIIVVDDCSQDRTPRIIEDISRRYPEIKYIRHEKNVGSGCAFKTGIAHATKEYVIFVPVDNPLDPADIQAYLPRMAVCDIIVGSRRDRVGYSRFARFASFMYNRIFVPLLFNVGVDDVNWIQVYRRRLFTDGIIVFGGDRFFWLVEILVQAKRNLLIVAEVPARMKKRTYGRATSTRLTVMLEALWHMLSFWYKIWKEDRALLSQKRRNFT
jgi:glycosyltransferase involved in cell wall biosynthesis